jgi:hypothetical protein
MTKHSKSRGWGSMTKVERKAEMARRRRVAEMKKNPIQPPENPNLVNTVMQTASLEYSREKHITDLQTQISRLRRTSVEIIANITEICLREIR